MNRFQKKILTIAAGLANIGLALSAAMVATYAWFATNYAASFESVNNTTNISTKISDSALTWEILKYNDDNKAGVSYNEEEEFFLQPYDEYLTQKTVHTNAILKAVVDVGSLTSASQLYVDITCADGHAPAYKSPCPSYTSNIAQFKSTVYSYTDNGDAEHVLNSAIDPASADTRYQTATAYFAGSKTPGTRFVSLHESTPNKRKNTITLCPSLNLGSDTAKQVVIYVECSYNPKLVSYYITSNNLQGQIDLTGDITDLNFRTGDAKTGAYVKVTSGSPLTSSGDYLITYDGYSTDDLNPAFDGSGTSSTDFTSGKNYVDVYSRKNMIRNTEVTEASSFNYDTSTSKLTSKSGKVVGYTGKGMGADAGAAYTNTLSYSNGHSVVTSNSMSLEFINIANNTRFNYYTAGNQSAVDLYKYDANADATLTVESITLQAGYKTSYYVGDSFVSPTVFAHMSDGTNIDVTSECDFQGFSTAAAGNGTVHAYYTDEDDGTTFHAQYNYTVTALVVTSIEVTTNPTKTTYEEGETFDPTGMVVTATYNSGNTAVIPNDQLTYKTTALNDSDTTFTISYGGQSDTIALTITAASVYTWDLVTSSSTALAAGEEVIIAAYSSSTGYALNSAVQSNYYLKAYEVTLSTDLKLLTHNSNCTIWTVGGSSGAYTFVNSGNYLNKVDDSYNNLGTTTDSTSTGRLWTVSLGSTYSTILNNLKSKYIIYDSSHTDFSTNTSSGGNILIYRKTAHAPLSSISLSNITDTYSTDDTFVYPTITAHYADSTSKTISASACTISGYNLSIPGTQTVAVSYTETYYGETRTKTASYAITVTAAKRTLAYHANGGSGSLPASSTEYDYGTVVTVLGNTGGLTKSGYVFDGWNTASNGSGATYQAGDTFTLNTNTTLYAKWTATYTVTYNKNNGTGTAPTDSSSPYKSGSTVTVLGSNGLTRSGYTFGGWNTESDGTGTNYTEGQTFTISANTTLYAKWDVESTGETELTFNFTSNPGGWPNTNSSTATDYTYTLDGVDYTFNLKNVKQNSGYLMLTKVATLGMPAISNKKLTKVVAYNTSGCSTSVKVGISSSNSSESYISGGATQTWSILSSSYTYNLSGTSNNTMYYLYVTNKNAQITKIVLTYS